MSWPTPKDTSAPKKHVVTIGGGHGQSTLVTALSLLDVDIIAMPGVADDGGCSGILRKLGVPPPGDIRRCLASLAQDRALATRLEARLTVSTEDRSVGNLVLAHLFMELGNLQLAVDEVARATACRGRVVPVALSPATLRVYDRDFGPISGESRIESRAETPMVVVAEGPEAANPAAIDAIAKADLIFMGPGSFVGSTMAAITTCNIAEALAHSSARRIFVENLFVEPNLGYINDELERILRDHLLIGSGGESVRFDTLRHGSEVSVAPRSDGSLLLTAPLARDVGQGHDVHMLATALSQLLELPLGHQTHASPHGDADALERWVTASQRFL